jgi:t-SNARE complex subunit (syntaxin)
MSFATKQGNSLSAFAAPSSEHLQKTLGEIRKSVAFVKSSLSDLPKASKEKRRTVYATLQHANSSAAKMQEYLKQVQAREAKATYNRWKTELEHEVEQISRLANQLMQTETSLHEDKEADEDAALLTAKQQALDFEVQFHYDLAQEREEKISRISESIQSVNEMFKELGTMVNEQGQTLDRIETAMDEAACNTHKTVGELTKAEEKVRGNRQRLCWLFLLAASILLVTALLGSNYFHRR